MIKNIGQLLMELWRIVFDDLKVQSHAFVYIKTLILSTQNYLTVFNLIRPLCI